MNKIKILQVVNSLCVGGIEQTVVNLCNNLDKNKYEVTLWVLTETHQDLLSRLSKEVNVYIQPLQQHHKVIIDIMCLFFSLSKLRKQLIYLSPDIIHTHIYQYNIFPFLVAMATSHLKFQHFHTIHTVGLHYVGGSVKYRIKLWIEKMCYRFLSTHLICVSKEVRRIVLNTWGNSCGEIQVVENGVNMSLFDRSQYPQKTEDMFIISYVARLVEGKNHITLLRAFCLLHKKYPNMYLWLIGDGNLRKELQNYAIAKDIVHHIRFYGNVENVPYILSQSSIAAFPSEYEGFSVSMIEMMAMGLPVVCSDIQSFIDVLGSDGALFFSVHDSEDLAKQIEKLYLNKELLKHYAERSVKLSVEYSVENMALKYDKNYTIAIKQ